MKSSIEECVQEMESIKQNLSSVFAENELLHVELKQKNAYLETIQQNIAPLSAQNEQFRISKKCAPQLALESSFQQLSVLLQEVTASRDSLQQQLSAQLQEVTTSKDSIQQLSVQLQEVTTIRDSLQQLSVQLQEVSSSRDSLNYGKRSCELQYALQIILPV